MEYGSRVVVKPWPWQLVADLVALSRFADSFNGTHCSVDQAHFIPEFTGEHDMGDLARHTKASKPLESSDEDLAPVWTALMMAIGWLEVWSMATLCWTATSTVAFKRSALANGVMSGTSVGLFHGAVPAFSSDLGMSQTKENASETLLLWVITSLMHDLEKGESLVKLEVGSSYLIREVWACVDGVERQIHDWW